jgi:hypothetical protein
MSAMGRSPVGVAIGVSGDAQTAAPPHRVVSVVHCQSPSSQLTVNPHSVDAQEVPAGSVHGAPLLGTSEGHGAWSVGAGVQPHASVPSGSAPQDVVQPGSLQHVAQPHPVPSL